MSLTPEQIEALSDKYLVGLFQEMEQDVLADIARRVRKTGRLTETAELMAQAMSHQGFSPAEIRSEVMKTIKADASLQAQIATETLEYKRYVADRVKGIVEEAKEAGNDLVANAGTMCFNDDLALWEEAGKELSDTALPQIIEATQKQTQGAMRNLTQTTALGLRDANGTPIKIMDAYHKALDKATLKVATGAFTGEEAINRVIKDMASSGVRLIEYHSASGRTTMTELDVAVRRNVRTGVGQMAGRVMEGNLRSTGVDLVRTSQHMGSRPEHAGWQNKIFSFSGKDKRYPSLEEGTGYGTVTGLKGANCSHNFYPYWPGLSVDVPDLKEPPPVKINGKEYTYYQATQKQRAYERKLRALKRETLIQENSGGDPKVISELKSKTRATSREYNSFSAAAGLKTKPYRARVVGFDGPVNKNVVQHTLKKDMVGYSEFRNKYVNKLRKAGDLTLTDDEIADLESTLHKWFDDNDYHINFSGKNLESILSDGFKPQQQILAEKADVKIVSKTRANVVDKDLFGTPLDVAPDQRCIYGSLGSKNWSTQVNSSSSGAFGDTVVKLKKDGLSKKVTWTSDDSMGVRKVKGGIAGLVDDDRVDFAGISRKDPLRAGTEMAKTQNLYRDFYDYIKQADDNALSDPDKFISDFWSSTRPGVRLKQATYVELQFHTDIGIDSIESICAPRSAYTDGVIKTLKSHNIPMYTKEYDYDAKEWVVTKFNG
jgi:hypothetical protein